MRFDPRLASKRLSAALGIRPWLSLFVATVFAGLAVRAVAGQPETNAGIHEIAGGLDSGGTFGAPVSLGCIRLNKFQAKLARWWTPRQAKFFVYFEPNRYRHFGDAATGKAKGSQSPASYPAPAASFAQATEEITG